MTMSTVLQAFAVERLGWAILHSLWQIAVVAVVFGLLSQVIGRRSIHLRYVTECCGLMLMVSAPAATFWLVPPAQSPLVSRSRLDVTTERERNSRDSLAKPISEPPFRQPASTRSSHENEPTVEPATMPLGEVTSVRESGTLPNGAAVDLAEDRHATESQPVPPAAIREQIPARGVPSTLADDSLDAIRPWLPSIVACWMLGVVVLSFRPITGLWMLRRLRRRGLSPADPEMESVFQHLVRRLNLRDNVRLANSTLVRVPCVVGFLRPMVLLPLTSTTGLSSTQVEAMIVHELAHIRRYDHLVNLAQAVIETLLFYHPAVWWLSRRIRQTREHCCDDLAIAVYPDRAAYAKALLRLADPPEAMPQPILAAGGGSLVERVRRITTGPSAGEELKTSWLAGGIALLVLAGTMLGVWTTSRPVVADQAAAGAEDQPAELPDAYRIAIEGGQSIEFAGIQGSVDGNQTPVSWRPDGRPRDELVPHTFTLTSTTKPGRLQRTFVFKASVNDDVHLALKADGGVAGGVSRESDEGVTQTTVVQIAEYDEGTESATVRLMVAAGPWKTVASATGSGGVQNGVKFLPQVYRNNEPQAIIAIFPSDFDELPDVRIVAEDRDHRLHEPKTFNTGGKANGTELKAEFAKPEDSVFVRYHVQKRDYVALRFTNVALQPGEPRSVGVSLNGRPIDFSKPLPADAFIASPPQRLRAPLDDAGSYVELVGIAKHPNPSGWWNGDGAKLLMDRDPAFARTSDAADADDRLLEMVWKAHLPPSAMTDGYMKVEGDVRMTMRREPKELSDGSVQVELITSSTIHKSTGTTDMTVKTAWGDWEPVAELPVQDKPYEDGEFFDWLREFRENEAVPPFVFLSRTRENVPGKDDLTSVKVVFNEDPAFNYRVVLEDREGDRHSLLLTNGTRSVRSAMFQVAPSSAKSYFLERRPFRIAQFRNISLWKGIPTSAFVVSPAEREVIEANAARLPTPDKTDAPPSYVLRTFQGGIITLPPNPDLDKRLIELQRRGALLKFGPADKEIIQTLRKHNADPDDGLPHIVKVDATEELAFLRWRNATAEELPLLRNIAGLDHLSLRTDARLDGLQVLSTLPDLRALNLAAREADPEIFAILGRLKHLEQLHLDASFQIGRNGFEAHHLSPLRHLKNLRELELADVDFTNEMLAHLAGLTNLELLYAGNSVTVTDHGLAHLSKLRKLQSLVLHRIIATDAGLAALAGMPELEWLVIPSDRYTDAGMFHLASMPKLGRVDLSGSQVTDAGLSILATAPTLREIRTTDRSLREIRKATSSLRKIDLRDTRVTQAGVDILKTAYPRLEIQWNTHRRVVGSQPTEGLALRIVPILGDEPAPLTLTEGHVQALKAELKSAGPEAARRRQQHFQWFRLADEQLSIPVMEQHDNRRYALLPAQSDWIMRSYIVRPEVVSVRLQQLDDAAENWGVALEISEKAAEKLSQLTKQFLHRRMAITMDDRLIAAPTIASRIGKSLVISRKFSRTEARDLAVQIAEGAGFEVDLEVSRGG